MTNQKAAEMIRNDMKLHHDYLSGTYRKALNMAISALEKQISKELIAEGDGYADGSMVYDIFYCPSCDHHMEWDEVEDYCPNCGQKICLKEE